MVNLYMTHHQACFIDFFLKKVVIFVIGCFLDCYNRFPSVPATLLVARSGHWGPTYSLNLV